MPSSISPGFISEQLRLLFSKYPYLPFPSWVIKRVASRVPLSVVNTLEDALVLIEVNGLGGRVLLDLENTLIPSGGDVCAMSAQINDRVGRIANLPGVTGVGVLTNRTLSDLEIDCIEGQVMADAHKPWSARVALSFLSPDVVIGDEFGTDGFFAWTSGAHFIKIRNPMTTIPLPTRVRERILIYSGAVKLMFRRR